MARMPKRVDNNQAAIVKALRANGCSVVSVAMVGKGCPDLVVGFQGKNFLVEVKNGDRALSGQKLTDHEQVFFDTWRGQVCIINSVDAALEFINAA